VKALPGLYRDGVHSRRTASHVGNEEARSTSISAETPSRRRRGVSHVAILQYSHLRVLRPPRILKGRQSAISRKNSSLARQTSECFAMLLADGRPGDHDIAASAVAAAPGCPGLQRFFQSPNHSSWRTSNRVTHPGSRTCRESGSISSIHDLRQETVTSKRKEPRHNTTTTLSTGPKSIQRT